jgi:hypothetical protein
MLLLVNCNYQLQLGFLGILAIIVIPLAQQEEVTASAIKVIGPLP